MESLILVNSMKMMMDSLMLSAFFIVDTVQNGEGRIATAKEAQIVFGHTNGRCIVIQTVTLWALGEAR